MPDEHNKTHSILNTSVIILLIFLIFPGITRAGDISLFNEMGIYGGQINVVAVDTLDPLIAYAGSYGGDGLFKTIDGGVSWSTVDGFRNSIVYDIAISTNGSKVWVAHSDKVSLSMDGGETWTQVYPKFWDNEMRLCYSVAIDPGDWLGGTVYIGTGGPNGADTNGAIFITTNNGFTWRKETLSGSYNIWDISFNSENRGEVWAASRESVISANGRIFMRPNYFSSWYSWDNAVLGSVISGTGYVDEIISQPGFENVFAAGGYGVMKFANDGSDITNRYFSFMIPDACRALAVDPLSNDIVYAGLDDKVAKSSDSGANWDDEYAVSGSGPFLSLSVAGSDPDVIFGGTYNRGVFVSEDGAETWTSANSGLLATAIYDSDISSQDSGRIVAASLSGVYFKDGTDAEWTRIEDESAYVVAFHPTNDGIIYAGFDRKIGKTGNGGISWTYLDVSASPDAHNVSSLGLSALVPDTILAGISFSSENGGGEIVKIIDSGSDFSLSAVLSVLTTDVPVNSVVPHSDDSNIVFAGTGRFFAPAGAPGKVYMSNAAGSEGSWTETALENVVVNNIAISALDSDIMYAACGDTDLKYAGMYRSIDGGTVWELLTGGLPQNLAVSDVKIDESDSDVVYAALYRGYNSCSDPICSDLNGIYATSNGGGYWSQIGLSDYYLYDVNSYGSGTSNRISSTGMSRSFSYPESTVTAGTGSGAYSSSMSTGRGMITGFVKDFDTKEPVTDVVIKTDTGSKAMTEETGQYTLFVASGRHRVSLWSPTHVSAVHPDVTVPNGGLIDLETDYLRVGSSGSSETTCFLEDILGLKKSDNLNSLRLFRDNVLTRSGVGKELIDIYYRSGSEAFKLINNNPAIKNRCLEIIIKLLPIINIRQSEGGRISGDLKKDLSLLMSDMKKISPPSLIKDINAVEVNMEKIISK